MANVKSKWTRYRSMGGPRYLGAKANGRYLHVYNPSKPWGIWSQILGVVARSEGRHDTVVMYDETGVTAGAFQWTFKSGRLQRLLEFLKSIQHFDFAEDRESTLFEENCTFEGRQIFERYGFRIERGRFVEVNSGKVLDPRKKPQQKAIVDICMGRRGLVKGAKSQALGLCSLFAKLGQQPDVQVAMVEYAKLEFKRSLDVKRKPLKSVGWTIRCLLPEAVWGSPIPAIFFNLNQNSPGGSFSLFKRAMKAARREGLVDLDDTPGVGYEMSPSKVEAGGVDRLLSIIWQRLNWSAYADWGFKSKQYLASGGKNPPRIKNIRPAIQEFYGIKLPFFK